MPMLVRNLRDRLRELHELRGRALARHDTKQAADLQAEIEDLTAYLDEMLEATAAGVAYPATGRGLH
jgi:hypothetical protein